uniref:Uncharacterized protein n=1 Tax=Xanthomonas citri pv. phaseoli var. fuscans TaxID=473423 RepID=A0A808FDR8_XANCI
MDYRDPETARRRSIFHQRIQIGFPGRSFVVDLQSYFSSLLEVNEAGQFMFIETWCQSIPLTEAFCQFIERADPQFEYEPVSQPLTLREAYEDAKR